MKLNPGTLIIAEVGGPGGSSKVRIFDALDDYLVLESLGLTNSEQHVRTFTAARGENGQSTSGSSSTPGKGGNGYSGGGKSYYYRRNRRKRDTNTIEEEEDEIPDNLRGSPTSGYSGGTAGGNGDGDSYGGQGTGQDVAAFGFTSWELTGGAGGVGYDSSYTSGSYYY